MKRASVIILVVAILALVFILGATILLVANNSRKETIQAIQAHNLRAINEAMTNSVLLQLREDLTGG
jgi:hypothetical protein